MGLETGRFGLIVFGIRGDGDGHCSLSTLSRANRAVERAASQPDMLYGLALRQAAPGTCSTDGAGSLHTSLFPVAASTSHTLGGLTQHGCTTLYLEFRKPRV